MRTEVVLDVSLWAFGGGRSFFIPICTLFYNTMKKKSDIKLAYNKMLLFGLILQHMKVFLL